MIVPYYFGNSKAQFFRWRKMKYKPTTKPQNLYLQRKVSKLFLDCFL
jgi:hypothetical protein